MNLVRAGHLYTPLGEVSLMADKGDCSTATVANVNEDGTVNVGVLDHMGLAIHSHTGVPVLESPTEDELNGRAPGASSDPENTFHLSGECPWKR